jgi:hypothetical protein
MMEPNSSTGTEKKLRTFLPTVHVNTYRVTEYNALLLNFSMDMGTDMDMDVNMDIDIQVPKTIAN